jgi:hypothetical protein
MYDLVYRWSGSEPRLGTISSTGVGPLDTDPAGGPVDRPEEFSAESSLPGWGNKIEFHVQFIMVMIVAPLRSEIMYIIYSVTRLQFIGHHFVPLNYQDLARLPIVGIQAISFKQGRLYTTQSA